MSKPIPLPKVARIGPLRYRISTKASEWVASEQNPEALYGYTDHERGTIVLHKHTAPAMRRVVLLHELLHATAFTAGQIHNKKRTEEEWVVMVAPMLLDALRRSPEVVAFLLSEDDE